MNITDPIRHFAQNSPDAPAVLNFGDLITYAQLDAVIDAIAARIAAMGLAAGDVAGVQLSDNYGQLAFTLALARLGVAAATSADVMRGVGKVARKTCFADAARSAGIAGGSTLVDESWWRSPARGERVARVPSHPDAKATCMITGSSGTTGIPKAFAISHELMCRRMYHKWLGTRMPDSARQICTLGIESYYGFGTALKALWTRGLVAASLPWADIHAAIALHRINCLVASPAQLSKILEELPASAAPYPTLEYVEVSGSTLPPRLAAQARARLSPNLYVGYGSAETAGVARGPVETLAQHPGAVGWVDPGVLVEVVDADGRPLPAGSEGVVRVRSPYAIAAYLGDAEANAQAFRDGWFYPGDVGVLADTGLLSIAGRTGEIINAGGVKVSPQYIENVVLENPDIAEAAVFTLTREATGIEEIWVAIVQRRPVDTAALHAHCARRLGGRAPKSILLTAVLPRNANGKLLREQLVAMAASATKISSGPASR